MALKSTSMLFLFALGLFMATTRATAYKINTDDNKLILLTAPAASLPTVVSKREAGGGFYTTRFGKRNGFKAASSLPLVSDNLDDVEEHKWQRLCLKALLHEDREPAADAIVCARSKDDDEVFVCRSKQ